MGKSWAKSAQIWATKRAMSGSTYQETVQTVLRAKYGDRRNGAKILARLIDCAPKTVRNWIEGVSSPRGDELIRLMVHCEELQIAMNERVKEGRCLKG